MRLKAKNADAGHATRAKLGLPPPPRKKRSRWQAFWLTLALLILAAAGYSWWALKQPLPALLPAKAEISLQIGTPSGNFSWPAKGQAAVGVMGDANIQTNGPAQPVAMASTAKLITALCVLQQKPLTSDLSGPVLTLHADDLAYYQSYVAVGGSVVPVAVGEQISEYQALQAMLLPSANNIADSLAKWAFGSLDAYSNYANSYLKHHGLSQTHVGADASGLLPDSTSTATDLVKIGQLVMQNPTLKQIVGQASADSIPNVGTIGNVNQLLGVDSIIGIKTGNNDQDPGVFLGAAQPQVSGHQPVIITAILGSSSLFQALHDSKILIESAEHNFATITAVQGGDIVGQYRQPWGGQLSASLSSGLNTTVWNGSDLRAVVKLQPIQATAKSGEPVGNLTIKPSLVSNQQQVSIKLDGTPTKPTVWWRLTHPLK
ncbi:MAG TPA: hypothetical protein VHB51_02125 [Candidatus Saccharimonadales bacterium]|nr:hypothetical protein [Candidatus Saccharimonadales bacterium]